VTETITLYWAPAHGLGSQYDYGHLYPEPLTLYEELTPYKADLKDNRDDYLRCPAVSNRLKKTFVFRSVTNTNVRVIDQSHVSYEITSDDDQRRHQTTVELLHKPTLNDHLLLNYSHPVIFFTDVESLTVSITAPFFQKTAHSQYGVIVPGEFDVAKWFRPMNFEFQLWEGVDELRVPVGDPLAYFECQTDAKVVLRKFYLTPHLNKLSSSLIHVQPHRRFAKLKEKYRLFEQAKLSKGILREIQANLMD
jgi:hypothetical protein